MKYGIISSQVTNQISCTPEALDLFVKSDTKYTKSNPYTNCTNHIDHTRVVDHINSKCQNKTECNIGLTNEDLYTQEYLDNQYTTIGSDAFHKGHCGDSSAFFI